MSPVDGSGLFPPPEHLAVPDAAAFSGIDRVRSDSGSLTVDGGSGSDKGEGPNLVVPCEL